MESRLRSCALCDFPGDDSTGVFCPVTRSAGFTQHLRSCQTGRLIGDILKSKQIVDVLIWLRFGLLYPALSSTLCFSGVPWYFWHAQAVRLLAVECDAEHDWGNRYHQTRVYSRQGHRRDFGLGTVSMEKIASKGVGIREYILNPVVFIRLWRM